ncbi:MAG: rhodanese-like domain-containing protein [Methylococcales bacterium]
METDRLIEFVTNHYILFTGVLVVIVLLIQDFIESAFRKYSVANPIQVVSLLNDDKTVLLDIRETQEFVKGHVENSRHIPLGSLDERIREIKGLENSPIIVICQTGTRSPQACKKLTSDGFTNVYNLAGGIQAWEDAKYPLKKGKK